MNIRQRYKNLNPNGKIIVNNTFYAFLIKGGALAISFLATPAFIHYFDNNVVLGLWYTLLSVLSWFLNFDLGIGNGIRNQLVAAFASQDEISVRKIISSGLFSISIISIVLFSIGAILLSSLDLNRLFNIPESLISQSGMMVSAILILSAIMLRFLLTTITAIFYALQKSAINNFLALCVSFLQLGFVLSFRFDDAEKALLVISYAFLIISNLPIILAAAFLFRKKLRNCFPRLKFVEKKSIKDVMRIGGIFFTCQMLYMLIANTNEFLVTRFFGAQYTAVYTFYYKLTFLISMMVTLAMTPTWSVVTKAYTEQKYKWLYKLYKTIKTIGYIAIILQFLLIPFLQPIMNIWLGHGNIVVNYLTAFAFASFGGVFVYSSMLSTVVCGMARMKLQMVFYSVGVILKIIFILILSRITDNWAIVVWSNVIVLLPYCIAQQIDLDRFLQKMKSFDKSAIGAFPSSIFLK